MTFDVFSAHNTGTLTAVSAKQNSPMCSKNTTTKKNYRENIFKFGHFLDFVPKAIESWQCSQYV